MKKFILFATKLIALMVLTYTLLPAQTIFSRFDFNGAPYTNATIGPNASSIGMDVTGNGSAIFIDANCGALKGIDLVIPNTAGIFNQAEIGMTFRFLKIESRSDFFMRGGMNFYQSGNELWISYRTNNAGGGSINYGPYNTGFGIAEDGQFHDYTFIYVASTGIATVSVDGLTVWTQDGPNNRNLNWTGALDPIVGTLMDGNCGGLGFLDYAYFFIPSGPLPVNFNSFEANAAGEDAVLTWTTENASSGMDFTVQRSIDGTEFIPVGIAEATQVTGSQSHAFTDSKPGKGIHYYRIVQESGDGSFQSSEIRTVTFSDIATPTLSIWPNPVNSGQQQLHFSLSNAGQNSLIKIYDIHGKMVATSQQGSTGTMDIQGFAPGIYFLNCEYEGIRLMEKLIVH